MIHGFSLSSLVLIVFILFLVLGTKRLRNIGEDLGAALKSFRKGMQETTEHEKD